MRGGSQKKKKSKLLGDGSIHNIHLSATAANGGLPRRRALAYSRVAVPVSKEGLWDCVVNRTAGRPRRPDGRFLGGKGGAAANWRLSAWENAGWTAGFRRLAA